MFAVDLCVCAIMNNHDHVASELKARHEWLFSTLDFFVNIAFVLCALHALRHHVAVITGLFLINFHWIVLILRPFLQ